MLDDDSIYGITTYQNGQGIDNKLKSTNCDTVKYFLQDHLGSTTALTDQSGAITAQTSYDSFGNATSYLPTSYQYTGREKDEFSGLFYYRARWYDSQVGRFISEDPIGFVGGKNWFAYVDNNPTNYLDSLGLNPFKLPAKPGTNGANLPKGWRQIPEHRDPNNPGLERWVSPNGEEGLEFHPGKQGEYGWEGKDHWHKLKPRGNRNDRWEKDTSGGRNGGHYAPGENVELDTCFVSRPDLSQPTLFELQANEQYYREMEKFWGTITVGTAVVGTVLTGGTLGAFGGASGAGAGGLSMLPAFGL